jgi:hypothetical protein
MMVQTLMARGPRCALAGVAVALALVGCPDVRPRAFPERGQVLYEGRPAAGARVIFHPDGGELTAARPSGKVEADGSFVLSTHWQGDGAPAGDYVVVVIWPPADNPKRGGDRLGGRYGDTARSRLRARVREGPNDLPPFELY